MNTSKNELNLNEMEMVNGAGMITGFSRFVIPDRKPRNGEAGNEQNNK
ncbi:MAG: hypothetical protein ILP14_00020 [Oscillospiraceae bacterium]|nr:hypothetical protein [Oscillospiraceae bacterium]